MGWISRIYVDINHIAGGACTLSRFNIHCHPESSSEDTKGQLLRDWLRFQFCYKWKKNKYNKCLKEGRNLFFSLCNTNGAKEISYSASEDFQILRDVSSFCFVAQPCLKREFFLWPNTVLSRRRLQCSVKTWLVLLEMCCVNLTSSLKDFVH